MGLQLFLRVISAHTCVRCLLGADHVIQFVLFVASRNEHPRSSTATEFIVQLEYARDVVFPATGAAYST
eukprot:4170347-Amphidinium_carterae.1